MAALSTATYLNAVGGVWNGVAIDIFREKRFEVGARAVVGRHTVAQGCEICSGIATVIGHTTVLDKVFTTTNGRWSR